MTREQLWLSVHLALGLGWIALLASRAPSGSGHGATGSQVAVPSPAGSTGATTPSALTSAPFSSIWTFATMFRSVGAGAAASAEVPFAESPPGAGWLHPAIPATNSAAEPIATTYLEVSPRTFPPSSGSGTY
jgi:hypothetical protein